MKKNILPISVFVTLLNSLSMQAVAECLPPAVVGEAYSADLKKCFPDLIDPTFRKNFGPDWAEIAPDGELSGTPCEADLGINLFGIDVIANGGGSFSIELEVVDSPPLPWP